MNLLRETIEELETNNKTLDDVKWVGCRSFSIKNCNIIDLLNVEYDSGYGGSEIAQDLIIVGDDWWIERHEYDGAEWWEFKSLPKKPDTERDVRTVKAEFCWESLEEMNK